MRLLLIISIITILTPGCFQENRQEEVKSSKILEELNKTSISEIIWVDYDEIIFLLASKYQLDKENVKSLIIDYLKIHDQDTYFLLTYDFENDTNNTYDFSEFDNSVVPKEKIEDTIDRLSKKYSIDKSVLSSLLFDFKIFKKLNSIE